MIDYKKFFRNTEFRYKILNFLSFVPDSVMLKIQYWIKLGRRLNLKNPQRFSEKIQWYKLHYRNEDMAQCANKWTVRQFVEKKGLGHILNICYGVYDSVEDIPFDSLPNQFVLKDTLGGGGTSVILVDDKCKMDLHSIKHKMQKWLDSPTNKKNFGREWVYEGKKHQIIVEKLLSTDANGDLPDYKFFCFDGNVFCSYFMENYTRHHDEGRMGFLDRSFNLIPVRRADFNPVTIQPKKPKNYEEMVHIAEVLSKGFPHVRIDLYNVEGNICFGEMTFFNASGYVQFVPDQFDFDLGANMKLK